MCRFGMGLQHLGLTVAGIAVLGDLLAPDQTPYVMVGPCILADCDQPLAWAERAQGTWVGME